MFSFKEKNFFEFFFPTLRSYSISLLVCSLSDGFSQTEVANESRFEASATTRTERSNVWEDCKRTELKRLRNDDGRIEDYFRYCKYNFN